MSIDKTENGYIIQWWDKKHERCLKHSIILPSGNRRKNHD